jgi:hypothetical protein
MLSQLAINLRINQHTLRLSIADRFRVHEITAHLIQVSAVNLFGVKKAAQCTAIEISIDDPVTRDYNTSNKLVTYWDLTYQYYNGSYDVSATGSFQSPTTGWADQMAFWATEKRWSQIIIALVFLPLQLIL